MGRSPRRVFFFLLLAALSMIGLWLARDLPRRWIQDQIAAASGASVRLEGIEILARDRFVLKGLEVERPSIFPGLKRLTIPRLEALASVGELRRGVFRQLRLDGVRAIFDRAEPPVQQEGTSIEILSLIMMDAQIMTELDGDLTRDTRLDVNLFRNGDGWMGTADLRSGRVGLAPIFSWLDQPEFEGEAVGLNARLRLTTSDDGNSMRARASSIALRHIPSNLTIRLENPGLDGRLRPHIEGQLRADLLTVDSLGADQVGARFPDLGGDLAFEEGRLQTTLTSAAFDELRLMLEDSGTLEASLHAWRLEESQVRGFGVERLKGLANIALSGSLERPRVSISTRLEETDLLDGQQFRHAGAELELTITPDLSADTSSQAQPRELWPLELELTLPRLRGGALVPIIDQLLPISAQIGGHLEPQSTAFIGRARARTALGVLALSGMMPVEFPLESQSHDSELEWRFNAQLAPLLEAAAVQGVDLTGGLRARGTLHGNFGSPILTSQVELRQLDASFGSELSLKGDLETKLKLRRQGDGWLAEVSALQGLVHSTTALGDVNVAVRSSFDGLFRAAAGQELGFNRLNITDFAAALGDSGELGNLDLEGTIRPDQLSLRLSGEKLDLAAWQNHLSLGLGGAELQGVASADLEIATGKALPAETRLEQALEIKGELNLEGLGAQSENGARVLAELGGRLQLSGERSKTGDIRAHASGDMNGFLVLWDAYFGDLSELITGLEARLELPATGDGWSAGLELEPRTSKAATRLALHLDADAEQLEVGVTLRSDDLEDLKDGILRPFQSADPVLATLRGGADLEARFVTPLEYSPDSEVRLHGRFRAWEAAAEVWEAAFEGLDLNLPFDLRRGTGGFSGPPLAGMLRIASGRAAGLELPAIASQLRVKGDEIALDQTLEVALLGGRLRFERVKLRDLLATPSAEGGIILDDLSIERLTRSLDLPVLEGQLDGVLPRVTVSREKLKVDGGGSVRLFGGEVRLRDISGRDIFTSFPRFRLSADIENLELGPLTRRFDFGEMQGVVRGKIDECVVVGGAPVAFDALFESVEMSGIKQTVDVKAVQNLTILGTGARPTLFDRGLQRFLKRYRYKKLGISVELRDDMLEMRGLVHEGQRELFLQGSLLFGIDIVNAIPGQRVSYSAMLRRLENLDLEKVRTE